MKEKHKIIGQCRNKLEDTLKPLVILMDAIKGSVEESNNWVTFVFLQNHWLLSKKWFEMWACPDIQTPVGLRLHE